MKKYAIIEITGGNPRYIGLFTVAEIFDVNVTIGTAVALNTFAIITNSTIQNNLMTPGIFKITKEISEDEYVQGTKKTFSGTAERALDSDKKYLVSYVTFKSKRSLSGVKYKYHWKEFSGWADNKKEAEEFYDEIQKQDDFYTGIFSEITRTTH